MKVRVRRKNRMWCAWTAYQGARLEGRARGPTFRSACENLFKHCTYFDKKRLTVWGLKLLERRP